MFSHDSRDQKKDLRELLLSVLVRLCRQYDSYSDFLSKFYSEYENGFQTPSDSELVRCLQELPELLGQAPVYLIIDALDECSNASALLSPREKVLSLVVQPTIKSQLTDLRICVTSRPRYRGCT